MTTSPAKLPQALKPLHIRHLQIKHRRRQRVCLVGNNKRLSQACGSENGKARIRNHLVVLDQVILRKIAAEAVFKGQ